MFPAIKTKISFGFQIELFLEIGYRDDTIYLLLVIFRWPLRCADSPKTCADPSSVEAAVRLLYQASRPLVIIGKGILKLPWTCISVG